MLKWLGLAIGVLSLVSLYQAGFGVPFAPPLQAILDADSELKRLLFQSLEPALQQATRLLNRWTGWSLQLYPYWKHIVVLLWLYFGAGARMAWRDDDRAGAVFRLIWGGLVAVLAGAAFGLVPMEPSAATALAWELEAGGVRVGGRVGLNLLSVLFPVAAIVAFALGVAAWVAMRFDREGRSWLAAFAGYGRTYPMIYAYVGFASVLAALLLNSLPVLRPLFETLPNPGLLLLFALTTALAVFLRWSDRKLDSDKNLGILMLQSLYGAAGLIFADAAWKLVQ